MLRFSSMRTLFMSVFHHPPSLLSARGPSLFSDRDHTSYVPLWFFVMVPVVELLQHERPQCSLPWCSCTRHFQRFVSCSQLSQRRYSHTLPLGGGWQFMTLRNILSKLQPPIPALGRTPTALVLDSVPDDMGLRSSLRAVPPTNPIHRLLVFPSLICLYVAIYIYSRYQGPRPLFAELCAALLQLEILPSIISGASPRLYVSVCVLAGQRTHLFTQNVWNSISPPWRNSG